MAVNYTRIYLYIIFAAEWKTGLIRKSWKYDLFKYVSTHTRKRGHRLITINSTPDRIHMLVALKPNQRISDFVQEIKSSSSRWINTRKLVNGRFAWQPGYGVFSYSQSQLDEVTKYINNREQKQSNLSLKEECLRVAGKHNIKDDDRFLFDDDL